MGMGRTFLSLVAAGCLLITADAWAAPQEPAPRPAAAKPASTAVVNLNTAAAADLEMLPGIGARTAALIVEYRMKNGPFKKIEDVMNVRGIGEKSFLRLKNQLTVTPAKAEAAQPR